MFQLSLCSGGFRSVVQAESALKKRVKSTCARFVGSACGKGKGLHELLIVRTVICWLGLGHLLFHLAVVCLEHCGRRAPQPSVLMMHCLCSAAIRSAVRLYVGVGVRCRSL